MYFIVQYTGDISSQQCNVPHCTGGITDLHIYNLDTVPPTDVGWNHVATDKLTTQDGDKFRTGAGVVANVRATPHLLTPVLPRHMT